MALSNDFGSIKNFQSLHLKICRVVNQWGKYKTKLDAKSEIYSHKYKGNIASDNQEQEEVPTLIYSKELKVRTASIYSESYLYADEKKRFEKWYNNTGL